MEVEFADRDVAVGQIEELAERGTYPVHVVYGPEGCGKTAFFRQAKALPEERGYHVVYFSPLEKEAEWRLDITEEAEDKRAMIDLINKLVKRNLVVDYLPSREPYMRIDQPPPWTRGWAWGRTSLGGRPYTERPLGGRWRSKASPALRDRETLQGLGARYG